MIYTTHHGRMLSPVDPKVLYLSCDISSENKFAYSWPNLTRLSSLLIIILYIHIEKQEVHGL